MFPVSSFDDMVDMLLAEPEATTDGRLALAGFPSVSHFSNQFIGKNGVAMLFSEADAVPAATAGQLVGDVLGVGSLA